VADREPQVVERSEDTAEIVSVLAGHDELAGTHPAVKPPVSDREEPQLRKGHRAPRSPVAAGEIRLERRWQWSDGRMEWKLGGRRIR
jgi:hypothetical protein